MRQGLHSFVSLKGKNIRIFTEINYYFDLSSTTALASLMVTLMQKILIINYYWPPSGGPNVQRWLTFSKHLLAHNIQTHVLTVDENQGTFPSMDYSLEAEVPEEVKVYRTETREVFSFYKKTVGKGNVPSTNLANEPNPNFLQKAARFVRGNFFIPDPRRGWNRFALPEARRIIEEENISIIATAGPPHSTHLIGRALKRENKSLFWIADFHDYWTDSSYMVKFYRTQIAHQIDLKYELSTLREADHILNHCQFGKRRLTAKVPEQNPDKFTVISMGYDTELFSEHPPKPQDEFRITFTGTITDNMESEVFFEVIKELREAFPGLPLKLYFVGLLAGEVRDLIEKQGLLDVLEAPGYVSHEEAIAYLYQSTILFLITPNFEGEETHVPGKLYEYLATEKPIFSISPHKGETAEIIRMNEGGINFERSQKSDMLQTLTEWVKKWQTERTLDLQNPTKSYQQYARDKETAVLAKIIQSA
ncbi:MAG: glycosyltransferase [Bacteroidota bacterium]